MSLPAESTGIATETINEAASPQVGAYSNSSYNSDISYQIGGSQFSWRQGATVGWFLVAVGVLSSLISYLQPEAPFLRTVSGVIAFIVAGALAFEFANAIKRPAESRAALFFVGLGGAALVCLAGIYASFAGPQVTALILSTLAGGPAVAAGAVILLRSLIDRIWEEREQRSSLVPFFNAQATKPIAEGEAFTIGAGVVVPTDGRIRAGNCAVLERYLSTDVHYRVKDEGEVVFAGSYVLGGQADVVALTGSFDSCLRRLESAVLPGIRWVEDSLRRDNERSVAQLGQLLIFASVLASIFWDERAGDPIVTLLASGSVLLCSLIVQLGDVLYALRSQLVRRWAQRGFLINSAKAWSELFGVKEILFDPSTVDSSTACHVRELELLDDRISERSLCACIASILGRAEDRSLAAVGDYCQQIVGAIVPDRIVDLREYDGQGISGVVKGVEFSIGSEEFLVQRGILIQPTESSTEGAADDKVVLVSIGDDLIARFWVSFGQKALISEDSVGHWPKGLHGALSDPNVRELDSDVLLVRGVESDSLGRQHSPEVVLFGRNGFEVPTSSVVSLTSHVEGVPQLVRECRKHVRDVTRARAWILFSGFVSLSLIFAGVVTPFLPVVLLPLVFFLIML
jgi:cation transport ATPase